MSAPALESYTAEQISRLPRKKLQALCKSHGIKANSKNVKLVCDLQNKLKEIQRQSAVSATKENGSSRSNQTSTEKSATNKQARSQSRTQTPSKKTQLCSAAPKSTNKNTNKLKEEEIQNQEATTKQSSNHNTNNEKSNDNQPNEIQTNKIAVESPHKKIQMYRAESDNKPEIPSAESANTETAENVANGEPHVDQSPTVEAENIFVMAASNTNVNEEVVQSVSISFGKQVADNDADANDDPHNGSFVDLESNKGDILQLETQQSVLEATPDETIAVQTNHQQYVNHNISSISNENNGSLMSPDIEMANEDNNESTQKIPLIINSHLDAICVVESNDNDDEESLDLQKTPRLNKWTEQFVQNSLNLDDQKSDQTKSLLSLEFEEKEDDENPLNDDEHGGGVDVMETPVRPETESTDGNNQGNVRSLEDEIGGVHSVPMRTAKMNTSLLSVAASRITVDSQDNSDSNDKEEETSDHEQASVSAQETPVKKDNPDSESPERKHTLLKSMEIIDSMRRSLSLPNDSSKTEDADDAKSNGKAEMDECADKQIKPVGHGDKDMNVKQTGNDNNVAAAKQTNTTGSSETVENLFSVSPSPMKTKPSMSEPRNVVEPKSELKHQEKSTSISMTFGDGQKIEFKLRSVSATKSEARLSLDCAPEMFKDKIMAIRQMMDEAEREFDRLQSLQVDTEPHKINKSSVSMLEDGMISNADKANVDALIQTERQKSMNAAGSAKKNKEDNLDWNAIQQKHMFSRAKERTERLARGLRQRSKSMIGDSKQVANSEKSPQDNKFHEGANLRLNHPVQRAQTQRKHNFFARHMEMSGILRKKKASKKPMFNSSFTEDTIIESDGNNSGDSNNGNIESNRSINSGKVVKIPEKKLEFHPSKVGSKLNRRTRSRSSKIKSRQRSQTPQVKSLSRGNMLVNRSKIGKQKNWSEVKSKVDTGLSRLSIKKAIDDTSTTGIKRKLSWSVSRCNRNEVITESKEPAAKKRRMSQQVSNAKRWV